MSQYDDFECTLAHCIPHDVAKRACYYHDAKKHVSYYHDARNRIDIYLKTRCYVILLFKFVVEYTLESTPMREVAAMIAKATKLKADAAANVGKLFLKIISDLKTTPFLDLRLLTWLDNPLNSRGQDICLVGF